MAHKQLGLSGYVFIWLALLALTTLSFGASFAHFGARLELVVALAIAVAKTVLVMMFFMHLIEQRAANRFVVVIAVLLTLILITLTAADVATRS